MIRAIQGTEPSGTHYKVIWAAIGGRKRAGIAATVSGCRISHIVNG